VLEDENISFGFAGKKPQKPDVLITQTFVVTSQNEDIFI